MTGCPIINIRFRLRFPFIIIIRKKDFRQGDPHGRRGYIPPHGYSGPEFPRHAGGFRLDFRQLLFRIQFKRLKLAVSSFNRVSGVALDHKVIVLWRVLFRLHFSLS